MQRLLLNHKDQNFTPTHKLESSIKFVAPALSDLCSFPVPTETYVNMFKQIHTSDINT